MGNPEIQLTLDEAVAEILGMLTGLDLEYQPELDRYRAITRQLNRALRVNALEKEWSYYHSTQALGVAVENERTVFLPNTLRPRIINDDAVRLVKQWDDDSGHNHVVRWAYFLPRDALHKYEFNRGLWCSVTRNEITFSRYFTRAEDGLEIHVPVMREPLMFRLPDQPEDPDEPRTTVPDAIRNQLVDFEYPDVITLRAAFLYAQTDPVMQPRVQTIEAQYKDLMYQIIERDDRNTDSPYINDFVLGLHNGLHGHELLAHTHPHAADMRWGD